MQAQEPKTRVAPLGMLFASFDPAIEFTDELAESPTSVGVYRKSCSGISLAVGL